MKSRKMLLPALLAIVLAISLMPLVSVAGTSATLHLSDDRSIVSAVNNPGAASAMALNTPHGQAMPMVAAGYYHTVGVKADGTAIAVGDNIGGQCDVGDWTDIIQVAGGYGHTVGLKVDGTVVAVGYRGLGQSDVNDWTNIVWVTAGSYHTIGLKANGTVVAVGDNSSG